jgi:hypothetical protein
MRNFMAKQQHQAKQEYQVTLEMDVGAGTPEQVEDDLERLVVALTDKAAGLALGPAGAIHGPHLELLFTVEATDSAEMYSKLHDIAVILREASDMDFATTSARRGTREFALA